MRSCFCSASSFVFSVLCPGWHVLSASVVSFPLHCRFLCDGLLLSVVLFSFCAFCFLSVLRLAGGFLLLSASSFLPVSFYDVRFVVLLGLWSMCFFCAGVAICLCLRSCFCSCSRIAYSFSACVVWVLRIRLCVFSIISSSSIIFPIGRSSVSCSW